MKMLPVPNARLPSVFLTVFPVMFGVIALFALTGLALDETLSELTDLHPLSWRSLLTAAVCGAMIGWERQLRSKPTGMRTCMLITIGTYVFVAISIHASGTLTYGNDASLISDPSRVIGQVVTGIGFLGAGVMFTRKGSVNGVTSAATIWVLAAIGVCVGVGALSVAMKLAMFSVVVLIAVDGFDAVLTDLTKVVFHPKSRYRGQLRRKFLREESQDTKEGT